MQPAMTYRINITILKLKVIKWAGTMATTATIITEVHFKYLDINANKWFLEKQGLGIKIVTYYTLQIKYIQILIYISIDINSI